MRLMVNRVAISFEECPSAMSLTPHQLSSRRGTLCNPSSRQWQVCGHHRRTAYGTEQREVPASCLKTIGQALKSATRTLHCTSASFVGDANADLRFGEFDVDRRGSTWSVPGGVRQTFRAEEVRPTTASVADAIACVRQLHTPIYGLTLHFLPLRPTYWWSVRKKVERHGEGGASALQACRPEFRRSSHFALVERTSRRFEPTRSANWLLRA